MKYPKSKIIQTSVHSEVFQILPIHCKYFPGKRSVSSTDPAAIHVDWFPTLAWK